MCVYIFTVCMKMHAKYRCIYIQHTVSACMYFSLCNAIVLSCVKSLMFYDTLNWYQYLKFEREKFKYFIKKEGIFSVKGYSSIIQ